MIVLIQTSFYGLDKQFLSIKGINAVYKYFCKIGHLNIIFKLDIKVAQQTYVCTTNKENNSQTQGINKFKHQIS